MQRKFDTNIRIIWRGADLEDNGYFGSRTNLAKLVSAKLNGRRTAGGLPECEPKARWLDASDQFEVEFKVGRDPAQAVIMAACEATLGRLRPFGVYPERVWRVEALSVAAA